MLNKVLAMLSLNYDDPSRGSRDAAMQKREGEGGVHSSAGVWRNFRPIPNVSSFKINARLLDQFLVKFGLLRKVAGSVEIQPYLNKDINRYIEHQLRRMTCASELHFWRIAISMITRSRCFYLLALNHVFPRWYKTLSWKSLIRLYVSYRRRCRHEWMGIHFMSNQVQPRLVRGYVEKAGGKYRPLGVPSPSWRLYLHLWGAFLSWRYDHKLSDAQHGFRPGRGTATAWEAIAKNVLRARNIYEYDLVSFFDKVNLLSIRSVLMKFGVPESVADYLVEVNRRAIPKFQQVDLVDESRLRMRGRWAGAQDQFFFAAEYYRGVTGSPQDAAEDIETDFFEGVAQGTATGPFLSALALENSLFTMGNDCVQYADDGLFFGDSISFVVDNPAAGSDEDPWRGIEFNQSKSGWVKKDGVWLKPLKFLGLVYDGLTETLYSDTRSGKRLYFDKDRLAESLWREELGRVSPSGVSESAQPESKQRSFESLILSRFWTFVQSRLYNGSWNSVQAFQNFHFISSSKSWVRRIRFKERGVLPLDLYNASSVASRSLLEFLRNLDMGSRRESWLTRPVVAEAPLGGTKVPSREDRDSGVMTAIRWVMRREWIKAYALPTFDQFEVWMVYYVSRMFPHSVYTEEQMYIHYSLMYFWKKFEQLEQLRRELDGVLVGWRASLAGRDEGLRGGNTQYPWAGAARRRVEFLNSEHERLVSWVGAFQQHADRHFSEGRAFKAKVSNSLEDYRKLVARPPKTL